MEQHIRKLFRRMGWFMPLLRPTGLTPRMNAEQGELFMSVATVKAHISHILTKLDLNNRTQVALLAHDAGLTG